MVADDKMAAFHGAGLKRYLLTVMAAAAKAFKHPEHPQPRQLGGDSASGFGAG